jgi:hypothetical protein
MGAGDRDGLAPLNAYVLVEGKRGLLIDTSLPIVGNAVVEQLKSLNLEEIEILLTRPVEFDSMGNAELIIENFNVTRAYAEANSSRSTGPTSAGMRRTPSSPSRTRSSRRTRTSSRSREEALARQREAQAACLRVGVTTMTRARSSRPIPSSTPGPRIPTRGSSRPRTPR